MAYPDRNRYGQTTVRGIFLDVDTLDDIRPSGCIVRFTEDGRLYVSTSDETAEYIPVAVPPADATVTSVFGRTGNIVAQSSDYSAFYSPIGHNHDADYADILHTHSGTYEPAGSVSSHVGLSDPHTQYQKESEKGTAGGYAGLDSGTQVPADQLGSGTPSSSTFLSGSRAWTSVDWSVLSGKPASFTPSSHTHTASEVTDFATAWTNRMLAVLTTSGGIPYRTSVGGIGESKQGTAALGAYAIDWAAAHRFTKTLAGGDTFTHSNTEAKAAIYLVLTVNGQNVPSGIGTQVGGMTWDSGWTTAYLWITKDGAGGYEHTLSGA